MKTLTRHLIRLYQATFAPFTGGCCRFQPSCSHYATGCVERHGVVKGGALSLWRVLRCNPFAKPGFDPVPEK